MSSGGKAHMQAGSDGQVRVAINGIFNDAPAAAKYAIQHNDGGVMPLYMPHFPRADSTLGELMVAGYQRFLENDSRGLSHQWQPITYA